MKFKNTSVIILFFASCSFSLAQKASINSYLEAVGGEERWKGLSSLIVEAESEYIKSASGNLLAPQISTKSHTRAVSRIPDLFKIEIVGLRNGNYTLICNGKELREIFEGGHETNAPEYIINEYKKRSFHLGEPWIVLNAEKVEYLRNEIVDNKDCSVFSVIRLGLERLYYIQNEDNLLYMVSMFEGKAITYFSDYRNMNGYLVPFKKRGFVTGKLEVESTIKKIEFNSSIPDSEFTF